MISNFGVIYKEASVLALASACTHLLIFHGGRGLFIKIMSSDSYILTDHWDWLFLMDIFTFQHFYDLFDT